jgi:isochorismate pyruvate lyase
MPPAASPRSAGGEGPVTRKPAEARSREEVRAEIDRLDRELVRLLGERFGFIRRMAEIKSDPAEAYHQDRVDAVLANVLDEARKQGLDPALAEKLWRLLIDWNVEFEARTIAARQNPDDRT